MINFDGRYTNLYVFQKLFERLRYNIHHFTIFLHFDLHLLKISTIICSSDAQVFEMMALFIWALKL